MIDVVDFSHLALSDEGGKAILVRVNKERFVAVSVDDRDRCEAGLAAPGVSLSD